MTRFTIYFFLLALLFTNCSQEEITENLENPCDISDKADQFLELYINDMVYNYVLFSDENAPYSEYKDSLNIPVHLKET